MRQAEMYKSAGKAISSALFDPLLLTKMSAFH